MMETVTDFADWLHDQRGPGDDGRVYADVAELKLRTVLGEHDPDRIESCRCQACAHSAGRAG